MTFVAEGDHAVGDCGGLMKRPGEGWGGTVGRGGHSGR